MPEWLSARRADPQSRVILMSGSRSWSAATDQPCAEILTVERLGEPLPEDALFLGEEDGAALFAADLGRAAATSGRFAEVRAVGAWLPAKEAGWCAYARALAFWHSRHRYCGVCGGPRSALRAATSGAVRSATPSTSRAATRRSSCS